MTDTLPPSTHIGRVGLRVADQNRVSSFYRDVLALEQLSDGRLGSNSDELLRLHETDGPEPGAEEAGLFHTAFRVRSRAALGDVLLSVEDDWELDGAGDHGVSIALYLSDPEDNGIEVYWDRPREDWPEDDGRIRMTTEHVDLAALRDAAAGDQPRIDDIGHVHLETVALPAAHRFYAEKLGMQVRAELPRALFLAAGDYHHHIGCNTWNRRSEPKQDSRGLDWFEVVVQDVAAVVERFDADQVSDRDDYMAVQTPEGVKLRLTED